MSTSATACIVERPSQARWTSAGVGGHQRAHCACAQRRWPVNSHVLRTARGDFLLLHSQVGRAANVFNTCTGSDVLISCHFYAANRSSNRQVPFPRLFRPGIWTNGIGEALWLHRTDMRTDCRRHRPLLQCMCLGRYLE